MFPNEDSVPVVTMSALLVKTKSLIFAALSVIPWDVISWINPRPDGGVVGSPPSGFSRIAKKRRLAAPPFFAYLISHPFCTFSENFVPRSGQVKWPHLKSLWCYSSHIVWAINMKLSGYHKTINTYKPFISDFRFRWPKVRSILW